LSGKVAVVTGAASGIGLALAARLRDEGASVWLVDLPGERLDDAAAQVGGRAIAADVSSEDDVLAVRDEVGHVDVLCNNAGVMGPIADPLWDLPFAEWERVLRVNLLGRAARSPHVRTRHAGVGPRVLRAQHRVDAGRHH
jgi:1-deoxy-11beta-hydroxypentalenate dehydrogenase